MRDPFSQFVSYLLGDLSPPKPNPTRRYINGKTVGMTDRADVMVASLLRLQGEMSAQELVRMTGYSLTTVYRVLDEMIKQDVIVIEKRKDSDNKNRRVTFYRLRREE